VKTAAAARIALHGSLVFGIAFSACVALEKSRPRSQADIWAEQSQNPDLLSFEELVALASSAQPKGVLAVRFNDRLFPARIAGKKWMRGFRTAIFGQDLF
jgi:hypothetical protein